MTDENLTQNNVSGEAEDMTQDYLAAIKELKENSVDRQQFEQLKAENKKLLEAVVNGQSVEAPKPEVVESIDDLRHDLFNNEQNISNLDFVTKALELRKQLIAKGEPDPFIPYGSQISPTDFDIQKAQSVANVFQECVDYAEGDSGVFTNELLRRTQDVKIR